MLHHACLVDKLLDQIRLPENDAERHREGYCVVYCQPRHWYEQRCFSSLSVMLSVSVCKVR